MMKNEMYQWITYSSRKFWRIWLAVLVGGLILILPSLFFIDQRWAQHFGSPELIRVWLFHRNITEIGKAEPYIILALLALLVKKFRKHASYLLACMLASGLALHIIKICVGRTRPHKAPENNPFLFEPFNFHHHFQSFPSGHSQTLFSIATFLAFLFPKSTPWVFAVALYLSFTRAITLAHFVSDVWAGAILGILVSACTLRYLVKKYGS